MNPTYSPSSPSDFIIIFGLIAAVLPGFLASWKRPGMAVSVIFMSFCSVAFAVSGSKLTADVVYAVVWVGAMLLAGLTRVIQGVDELRVRFDTPVGIRIAPDDVGDPPTTSTPAQKPPRTAPISPPPGGWTTNPDLRRDPQLD